MNQFGLEQSIIESIGQVFKQHPRVQRVLIYGSRAKGNYRVGSDIDLSLFGELDLTEQFQIENELDDLLLPYKFDVSIYDKITDSDVQEHVMRVGKVFYEL